MNILSELVSLMNSLSIPVETGVFSGKAPETYVVLVPLADNYDLYADNRPHVDSQEVRISLYSKGNYRITKKAIEDALIDREFVITGRTYLGHEDDTGFYHISIDVQTFKVLGE